jgi:methionyl-tRNA formyltransferase
LDNATSLYQKILDVSQEQIAEFTVQLLQGTARFKKQADSGATYWRKRTRSDGLINWRMQADDVHNLVRALSPPYPGAECIYKGESFWVRESMVALESHPYFIEPGKILEVKNTNILVKCAGSSALWINQPSGVFDPDVGEYL